MTVFYKKPVAASWSDYHRARKYHRRKNQGQPVQQLYWNYHGKVFPLDLNWKTADGKSYVVPLWDHVTLGDGA